MSLNENVNRFIVVLQIPGVSTNKDTKSDEKRAVTTI